MLNFDLAEFDLLQFDFSTAIKVRTTEVESSPDPVRLCPATNNAQL